VHVPPCQQGTGGRSRPSSPPSHLGSTRAAWSPRATRRAWFARGAGTVWDEPHRPAGTTWAAGQGWDPRAPGASGRCMGWPRGLIPGPPHGGEALSAHQPHGVSPCWSHLLGVLQGPQGPPGRDGAAGQPGPKGERVSVPWAGEHRPAPGAGQLLHTLFSFLLLPRVMWATSASLARRDPRYRTRNRFLGVSHL